MWNKTRVSEVLGIEYPIIQGPFGGGYSSVELVSTVSEVGGLGSFGALELTPQEIIDTTNSIKASTSKPFAINLWVSDRDEKRVSSFNQNDYEKLKTIFQPYFDEFKVPIPPKPQLTERNYKEQVEALLEARPPVFSFIFGVPSKEIFRECRKRNIKTMGAATTPDEAVLLEEAGVDIIVATGFEAGGHRVSFLRSPESSLTGTFSLTPLVADKVKIPVVAAGGIADARGIAAAMILGAQGVQIGTAFLACTQSNASEAHREKLFSDEAKYTVLTKVFSGRLARGIRGRLSEELQIHEKSFAPFPLQGIFLKSLRSHLISSNRNEYLSFWAGQSAPLLKYKDARELFNSLVQETGKIMSQVSARSANEQNNRHGR
jgi:nitronate monooxygenase